LVCRNIPLRNRYAYEGDERELPSSAPPIELIPNVGHRIFDKKIPIGHIWKGRYLLSLSGAHTDQEKNVTFVSNFVVSVLFGKDDYFSGSKRIFAVKDEQTIIKFLKTLFIGSAIKIIIDLNTCPTTLDIEKMEKKKKSLLEKWKICYLRYSKKEKKREKKFYVLRNDVSIQF